MTNSDKATQELLDMASALDPKFKIKYENAPLKTAAMPADVTEDAAAPKKKKKKKKKKKGLGNFFKVTTYKVAEPPLQQKQVIALELQPYLQTETLVAKEDPLKSWRESQRLNPLLSNLG